MLDELDRELERRGHRHVRYADDCNLCPQPTCGRASDGEHHSASDHAAQTQSEPGEECSGSAERQEVPGIQLHELQASAAPDCAESDLAIQGANPGADVPGHEGSAWSSERNSSRVDGVPISASARHPRCSPFLISGSGADYGLRCGSSGSMGTSGLRTSQTRHRTGPGGANGGHHGPWRLAESPALHYAFPNSYFDSLGFLRLTGGS